jgi:signal transduction histidine kinase
MPDQLPSDRNGLLRLRERAELLGGSLHSRPLADGDCRLSMRLPLHA